MSVNRKVKNNKKKIKLISKAWKLEELLEILSIKDNQLNT